MKKSWLKDGLNDLKDRYDKKYRKYLSPKGKAPFKSLHYQNQPPASKYTPLSPGNLATGMQKHQVSMAVSDYQLEQLTQSQAAQYQGQLLQQIQNQLIQQQAQMATQVMMNGNSWTTQTVPSVSTYPSMMNATNVTTYSIYSGTTTNSTNNVSWYGSAPPSGLAVVAGAGINSGMYQTYQNLPYSDPMPVLDKILKVRLGDACDIQLPDGSVIKVSSSGAYEIDDKNAKVIYKANRNRDFNRFINVSDRIEEFFEFCGQQDLDADEMMELPMKLFIGWLVLKAAEADKEVPPDNIKLIPDLRARAAAPRCRQCKRFISYAQKKSGMEFCGSVCYDRKLKALQPKALPKPDDSQNCDPFICQPTTRRSAVLQEVEPG